MSTEAQKPSIIQQLQQSTPAQIANLPDVAERFRKLYQTFNGKDGSRFYEAEKFHFSKLLADNPKLAACTKMSLYGCFMDMAVQGLSFDPSMKHAYMVPFAFKVGKDPQTMKEIWEDRAQLQISGIGELALRTQQGQIKYADNPVLVYENDVFITGTENDKFTVTHKVEHPRTSDNIIACYLKITRIDDSIDYKVLTMPEIQKLRNYSKAKDSAAWDAEKGLPGMIQSKTIKHAFRTYPKLRVLQLTKFTQLASETTEEEHKDIDIYGDALPGTTSNDQKALPEQPVSQQIPQQQPEAQKIQEDFAQPNTQQSQSGKRFDDDDF